MSTALPPTVTPGTFTLHRADAERLTGGRWIGTADSVTVRGAALDSRAVLPGTLFACITGKRVDGHDFADRAVASGAALVLAGRPVTVQAPVLVVTDVAQALAQLAAEYRRRIIGVTWIAVAGSNGKTTVKELIARACAADGATHATSGNLNNHLGLPITVLNTPPDIRYAVIELGANHPGENAQLAAVVQPHVAVVTSVGSDHLEGFGSIVGVARASGEVFAALPAGATAVLGGFGLRETCIAFGESHESCLLDLRLSAEGRTLIELDIGNGVSGSVSEQGIELTVEGRSIPIALLGEHNVVNAAVAWHAARAAGVPAEAVATGLSSMRAVAGRLHRRQVGDHVIIDDAYNANPASMVAALAVLAATPGLRLAVLGHMGELGGLAEAGHRQVGAAAARHGLPVVTVGASARTIGGAYRAAGGEEHEHHDDLTAAVATVRTRLAAGPTTVLVKASRSAGLDALVTALAESPC